MNFLNARIVEALREKNACGQNAAELLRFLSEEIGMANKLLFLFYFKEAFQLSLGEAKAVYAWQGIGGGASDEELDALLVLKKN